MNGILPDTDSVNKIHQELDGGHITSKDAALRLARLAQGNLELQEAGTATDAGFLSRFIPSIIKDGMNILREGKKK